MHEPQVIAFSQAASDAAMNSASHVDSACVTCPRVSYDELEAGAENVPEFRHRLRVMDVKRDDLQQLFAILDEDGSGQVDPDEFIEVSTN